MVAKTEPMHCFTTYCDLAFLDQFYRTKPTKDVAEFGEEDELWLELHRFLKKSTNLVVNASEVEELIKGYPFLRYLLNPPAGVAYPRFDPSKFSRIEENEFHEETTNPWKLFLLNDTNTPPEQLSAAYGTLFLDTSAALQTWARIGRPVLLNVSDRGASSCFSWADLERFATPLTSLLVCDPYLLARAEPRELQENVVPLVVGLLPQGQNKLPVEIMLMTRDFDGKWSLEDVRRKLEALISEQHRELTFSLSLIIARGLKDYHDRHVFMNYGFMKSGQSFNYFKKGKLELRTTIDFEPVVDSGRLQTAINKLQELARMVESSSRMPSCIAGSKENALLRAAQQ